MERREFLSASILGAAVAALDRDATARPVAAVPQDLALELPIIMDYTVLPSSLVARAWMDDSFRASLLDDPDPHLRATPMKVLPWPTHIHFEVHEETAQELHFPLPLYKPIFEHLSRDELYARLRHETYCETTLDFFLPVDVIWTAWFDSAFKARLLSDATGALREMGYATERRVQVWENVEGHYHLTLKASPFEVRPAHVHIARARYTEMMTAATSSQCCASGTCDEVPI